MKIKDTLVKYNQTHLLDYIDELDEKSKIEYIKILESIDYEFIKNTFESRNVKTLEENYYSPIESDKLDKALEQKYAQMGFDSIKNNEVAALLVAGGQGTRLGFPGPKGMYDINLPSNKKLFEIYIEKLIYLYNKTKSYIPIYIMTSNENHNETIKAFENHNYFGYNKDYVKFFIQESLPAFDEEGKIMLKNKNEINFSPNGNGGCFKSLKNSGLLQDMESKNVKWVFLFGVDNVLCKVCDPVFIGHTISKNTMVACKAIEKNHPLEKVGVICRKNNKPTIVEYSELNEEMIYSEKYNNANMLNHILNIEFIKKIAYAEMPIHLAYKKIECIDKTGNKKMLEKENGYKMEYFLFDVFSYADDMSVLKVERDHNFAPVKNASGIDTPEIARQKVLDLHKKFLINNNITEDYELDFKQVYDWYDLISDDILKSSIKF